VLFDRGFSFSVGDETPGFDSCCASLHVALTPSSPGRASTIVSDTARYVHGLRLGSPPTSPSTVEQADAACRGDITPTVRRCCLYARVSSCRDPRTGVYLYTHTDLEMHPLAVVGIAYTVYDSKSRSAVIELHSTERKRTDGGASKGCMPCSIPYRQRRVESENAANRRMKEKETSQLTFDT